MSTEQIGAATERTDGITSAAEWIDDDGMGMQPRAAYQRLARSRAGHEGGTDKHDAVMLPKPIRVAHPGAALELKWSSLFQVTLSNNRIVSVQDDRVTFRYRDGDTGARCLHFVHDGVWGAEPPHTPSVLSDAVVRRSVL